MTDELQEGHRMIEIQIQDVNGYWLTVQTTMTGQSQYLLGLMHQIQRTYKGRRVRAIENGHLLDILQ